MDKLIIEINFHFPQYCNECPLWAKSSSKIFCACLFEPVIYADTTKITRPDDCRNHKMHSFVVSNPDRKDLKDAKRT